MAESLSTTENAVRRVQSGDITAKQARELEKKKVADAEAKNDEASQVARAKARAAATGVFDPSTGAQLGEVDDVPEFEGPVVPQGAVTDLTQSSVPAIVDVGVDVERVENPHRIVRINETVENLTFGVGTLYTFIAGQRYKVPADLAEHLEEHGLVWH